MIMNTREDLPGIVRNGVYFVRWTLISLLMGTVCGLVGTAFGFGVAYSQQFFRENPFMLFLMPVSGILIVLVHKALDQVGNKGTNLILESISSTEQIRFSTLPCIFISTILSHLTGASAGKEGAALQIGGCIGNTLGGLFHMDERDKKVAIMSGMSGCFGAIFGTPLAASMFGMEVISVGVAYYAALVPCVFSAFIGSFISSRLGLHGEAFTILHVPEFSLKPAALIVLLALLGAFVSVCFCILLHEVQKLYKAKLQNVYARILTASALFGGFKGGEIVPTLAVGATMGAAFGNFLGFEPSLCAACGMLALFAGVTNCPVATIFMGFELFGFEGMKYFALAVSVSFALSGYYGLYSSQKFTYSKTRTEFINRKAH